MAEFHIIIEEPHGGILIHPCTGQTVEEVEFAARAQWPDQRVHVMDSERFDILMSLAEYLPELEEAMDEPEPMGGTIH